MRKETAFIITFLVFTIGTALVIWMAALPNFVAVRFPEVTAGKVVTGPMRQSRPLTQGEVAMLNDWFRHHPGGWGPLSQTPPSSGDARVELEGTTDGHADPIVLTLWTGISAADWNNTVFLESPDGSKVRTESFSDKDFEPLRKLADGQVFPRSAFP
ncbi:MAG: hypothetical protein ABF876_03645 [Acetobacter aceti]|uniref:Uncharacterized protein n=1 Tax=Acetobacter aceti TaxID=435 RepID=A0A1U9KHY3_ACEAC|nr:hypothetical protein [Acetobacter aceti]AQS85393.1 hypothetical protein A0U92_12015 [Acetobacter aceti]